MNIKFHQIFFVEDQNVRPISGDVTSKPDVTTTQRYSAIVYFYHLKDRILS